MNDGTCFVFQHSGDGVDGTKLNQTEREKKNNEHKNC